MPALAVAGALRASGATVEFAGGDRIESQLVPEAGYPFHRFAASGLPRRPSPELLRAMWRAGSAPLACRRIIVPGAAGRRVRRRRVRVRPDAGRRQDRPSALGAAGGGRAHGLGEPDGGAAGRPRVPELPDRGQAAASLPGHGPSAAGARAGRARPRPRLGPPDGAGVRRQPGRAHAERGRHRRLGGERSRLHGGARDRRARVRPLPRRPRPIATTCSHTRRTCATTWSRPTWWWRGPAVRCSR